MIDVMFSYELCVMRRLCCVCVFKRVNKRQMMGRTVYSVAETIDRTIIESIESNLILLDPTYKYAVEFLIPPTIPFN